MRPPEEIKTEFTRDWIRKAEIDFKTAGHLCQSGDDFAERLYRERRAARERDKDNRQDIMREEVQGAEKRKKGGGKNESLSLGNRMTPRHAICVRGKSERK
jgi:hypothetical protein